MSRLIFLRSFSLILRPIVILSEGLFLKDEFLVVVVTPIAMMVLLLSSIPLHADLYKQKTQASVEIAKSYGSSLILLVFFTNIILVSILNFFQFSNMIICLIVLTFLIEKFCDEICRYYEFNKKYYLWFIFQLVRSGWFLVAISFGLLGFTYDKSAIGIGFLTCLLSIMLFYKIIDTKFSFKISDINIIWSKFIYIFGAFMPASYRQIPKILVSSIYPNYAHAYIAISQIAQGTTLLFNIKYQIPYRKVIARKPYLFQRRKHPLMIRVLVIALLFSILWSFISLVLLKEPFSLSSINFYLLLVPIICIESLFFAVLSAHLGYLLWIGEKKIRILTTYILCLLFFFSIFLIFIKFHLAISDLVDFKVILIIPAFTILMGISWTLIILKRHFSNKQYLKLRQPEL